MMAANIPLSKPDVSADRRLGQEHLLRDLPVRQAEGHLPQHLDFARGQRDARRLPPARRAPRVGQGGEPVEQPSGGARRDDRVPGVHDPDRVDQVPGPGVLEQEPRGAGLDRLVDVLVDVERGQDEHPRGIGE
jgi:hypothetical protein